MLLLQQQGHVSRGLIACELAHEPSEFQFLTNKLQLH